MPVCLNKMFSWIKLSGVNCCEVCVMSNKSIPFDKARNVFDLYDLRHGFNVRELAENIGLQVKYGRYKPSDFGIQGDHEFDGAIDYKGKIIYVNADHSIQRRRFTIAHELGHFFLHKPKIIDERNRVRLDFRGVHSSNKEIQANYFASELLMPKTEVDKYIKDNSVDGSISASDFANHFRVSFRCAEIRLERAGYV